MDAVTRTAERGRAGLLASAAAGDEMAFRRIIVDHHDDMRRVAAYVAGDHAIADEATQAAWLIAWKNWPFGLEGFYRLGADAMHQWDEDFWRDGRPGRADIEVGPEGTIWLQPTDRGRHLVVRRRVLDHATGERQERGAEWPRGPAGRHGLDHLEYQPPGGKNKPQPRVTVARLGTGGWEDLPGSVEVQVPQFDEVVVADGGGKDVRLLPGAGRLRRHDGAGWVVQPTPKAGGEARAAVGPDGTLWVRLVPCGSGAGCVGRVLPFVRSAILARFDGEAWEVFGPEDGIPMMGDHYQGFEGFLEVAPDHSIWFNPNGDLDAGPECMASARA
jgi:hypothetical protein